MDTRYETALGEPFSLQTAKDKAAARAAEKDRQAKRFLTKATDQTAPRSNVPAIIGFSLAAAFFAYSIAKQK